jgi:hypothetical protein
MAVRILSDHIENCQKTYNLDHVTLILDQIESWEIGVQRDAIKNDGSIFIRIWVILVRWPDSRCLFTTPESPVSVIQGWRALIRNCLRTNKLGQDRKKVIWWRLAKFVMEERRQASSSLNKTEQIIQGLLLGHHHSDWAEILCVCLNFYTYLFTFLYILSNMLTA